MRQVWVSRTGPPEVLIEKEDSDPLPLAHEVRIRASKSGVNFSDVLIRLGVYAEAPALPAVIGYEVSGVIDAVGAEVSRFRLGDRVAALCRFGGYSDTVCVSEAFTFALPKQMSDSHGAAFLVNYLTAFQILIQMGRIRDDDEVLIYSAGGGVGLAAIDLCRIRGARVIGIASKSKHASLRDRGIERLIDPSCEDIEVKVRGMTSGRGVSLVLDPVGGESWGKSLTLLRTAGMLCVYGNSAIVIGKGENLRESIRSGATTLAPKIDPFRLISENKGVYGVHLGRLWDDHELLGRWAERLLEWYQEGKLQITVAKEFALQDAAAAHHYLQDRQNFGKVLLDCSL